MASSYVPKLATGRGGIFRFFCILLTVALSNAFPAGNFANLTTLNKRHPTSYFDKFNFVGCSAQQENIFKTAFSNTKNILDVHTSSMADVENYLSDILKGGSPTLTPALKTRMETIKKFYNEFDYNDPSADTNNIVVTKQLVNITRTTSGTMSRYAFTGFYALDVFCTDKAFTYLREGNGYKYYKNNHDPDRRELAFGSGAESGICDDPNVHAAMLHPRKGAAADWMLICPVMFKNWLGSESGPHFLPEYRAMGLAEMMNKHLDDIMKRCPEGSLLHELAHSELLFGVDDNGNCWENNLNLDDVEIQGVPAYQVDGVIMLARNSRNEPLKTVRNAETFAYDTGAAFLSQCNWAPKGRCNAPPT